MRNLSATSLSQQIDSTCTFALQYAAVGQVPNSLHYFVAAAVSPCSVGFLLGERIACRLAASHCPFAGPGSAAHRAQVSITPIKCNLNLVLLPQLSMFLSFMILECVHSLFTCLGKRGACCLACRFEEIVKFLKSLKCNGDVDGFRIGKMLVKQAAQIQIPKHILKVRKVKRHHRLGFGGLFFAGVYTHCVCMHCRLLCDDVRRR